MREVLLKKRYGIPVALLALLVLAGAATAVVVHTFTYEMTMEEPLSFTVTDDLDIEYQGESDNIRVEASNASDEEGYGIFVNATVEEGQVNSITYSSEPTNKLFSTEQKSDVNNDNDMWDARYNIAASGNYEIVITVDSADDAPPEDLRVKLEFHREAVYQ